MKERDEEMPLSLSLLFLNDKNVISISVQGERNISIILLL
jgi:hypothetical protein